MGTAHRQLKRELRLFDAIWMGLGSILGTGIFVSIGLAAGVAGPPVILAITLAAFVATFNALSAAQLAAAHPVSGGTYEYGYHYLGPGWGFMAGWMFLLAKSASAATAALGFAGYTLTALRIEAFSPTEVAFCVVVMLTVIVLTGARRTAHVNTLIVSVTVLALVAFIAAGMYAQLSSGAAAGFRPFFTGDEPNDQFRNLFEATALMFVAYTGYGRIATLAEEVENPRRVIPRAVFVTLLVSGLLYLGVSIAAIGTVGSDFLYAATKGEAAPLTVTARALGFSFLPGLIAVGAATAMLGVLLNLVLGLSRVLLAMGRRGDMPHSLTRVDERHNSPWVAVAVIGSVIAALTLIGSVETTWSFSALTVLLYYSITNAAALAVPVEAQLYPRWISWAGLASCLFLVIFIDGRVWLSGAMLAVAGAVWFAFARSRRGRGSAL